MRIQVYFQFITESRPSACTGIEDGVTDLLLPAKGDLVAHTDIAGKQFSGRVTDRRFMYQMPPGTDVDGIVTVTLFLDHSREN